eukprot:TRINITY_DN53022_c0_g1_i1.p1 TRINITY_DN53022_c0_g1~~TRINITY_DN53022_c0_g1_i1.p1  ORF type:complete len:120 (+),score=1.31 TRINITY_DN53022_c0_g1_i1:239-598(+)
MMGYLEAPDDIEEFYAPTKEFPNDMLNDIPESFNAKDKWTNCPSISEIRDQANCGSCWAVAAATAMTDRYCIAKNDPDYRISYQNLLSCCGFRCGFGCNGGYNIAGWKYWGRQGITTGD